MLATAKTVQARDGAETQQIAESMVVGLQCEAMQRGEFAQRQEHQIRNEQIELDGEPAEQMREALDKLARMLEEWQKWYERGANTPGPSQKLWEIHESARVWRLTRRRATANTNHHRPVRHTPRRLRTSENNWD